MSVAQHSNQAASSTTTTATTQSAGAGTGWPKLARGEIPSTWSKPAEVVTAVPSRAKSVLPMGPIIGIAVAASTALAVFVAMPDASSNANANRAHATADASDANAHAHARTNASANASAISTASVNTDLAVKTKPPPTATTPMNTIASVAVAEAIPAPPPTSSTRPDAVAPEDQGGDASADAAGAGDVVTELPARKKAKGLTARAIAALRGGDIAGAEPLLVRAVLVDPTLADAWRHLGIARAQLGDTDGARRAYRKYLELAPKAPDAAQVRAILASP